MEPSTSERLGYPNPEKDGRPARSVADAGPDVPNHPPVIDITFDGTGSYHLDPAHHQIVQYIWDFGDGSSPQKALSCLTPSRPSTTPTAPSTATATARDYVVTLTVVDDNYLACSIATRLPSTSPHHHERRWPMPTDPTPFIPAGW